MILKNRHVLAIRGARTEFMLLIAPINMNAANFFTHSHGILHRRHYHLVVHFSLIISPHSRLFSWQLSDIRSCSHSLTTCLRADAADMQQLMLGLHEAALQSEHGNAHWHVVYAICHFGCSVTALPHLSTSRRSQHTEQVAQ
jgi:hypothetical protein